MSGRWGWPVLHHRTQCPITILDRFLFLHQHSIIINHEISLNSSEWNLESTLKEWDGDGIHIQQRKAPCDCHSGWEKQLHLPQSFTCASGCWWRRWDSHLHFCLLSYYCWEMTGRALGSDTLTGHYRRFLCNFGLTFFLLWEHWNGEVYFIKASIMRAWKMKAVFYSFYFKDLWVVVSWKYSSRMSLKDLITCRVHT